MLFNYQGSLLINLLIILFSFQIILLHANSVSTIEISNNGHINNFCYTIPLSVSNIQNCINSKCSHETSSLLNFKYTKNFKSCLNIITPGFQNSTLTKSLHIEVLDHSVIPNLSELYLSGDPTFSTVSNCYCTEHLLNLEMIDPCLNDPIKGNMQSTQGSDFKLFSGIDKNLGCINFGWLTNYNVNFCTLLSYKYSPTIKVSKITKGNLISKLAIHYNGNVTNVVYTHGLKQIIKLDNLEITLLDTEFKDVYENKLLVQNLKNTEEFGIFDMSEINDKGEDNPNKLGFFQGEIRNYNHESITKLKDSHDLIDCSQKRAFLKLKYKSWQSSSLSDGKLNINIKHRSYDINAFSENDRAIIPRSSYDSGIRTQTTNNLAFGASQYFPTIYGYSLDGINVLPTAVSSVNCDGQCLFDHNGYQGFGVWTRFKDDLGQRVCYFFDNLNNLRVANFSNTDLDSQCVQGTYTGSITENMLFPDSTGKIVNLKWYSNYRDFIRQDNAIQSRSLFNVVGHHYRLDKEKTQGLMKISVKGEINFESNVCDPFMSKVKEGVYKVQCSCNALVDVFNETFFRTIKCNSEIKLIEGTYKYCIAENCHIIINGGKNILDKTESFLNSIFSYIKSWIVFNFTLSSLFYRAPILILTILILLGLIIIVSLILRRLIIIDIFVYIWTLLYKLYSLIIKFILKKDTKDISTAKMEHYSEQYKKLFNFKDKVN